MTVNESKQPESYSKRLQFLTQTKNDVEVPESYSILLNHTAESYSTENEYTSYLIFATKEAV